MQQEFSQFNSGAEQKKSKMTILLSVNAAAIVLAGALVAGAIFFKGGEFHVVGERSDIVDDTSGELQLLESVSDSEVSSSSTYVLGNDDYVTTSSHEYDNQEVPAGELWNETNITIYATPDIDICVGGGLSDLGDMYWQTSNQSVISGFYNSARTWLGYSSSTCKYPVVKGAGTTTITAGTYDGKRKDTITVTVKMPPVEQWRYDVLTLVNKIRTKNSLGQLVWGDTCADAALTRAIESKTEYSHTRPDGSSWATACPAPEGGISGENLAIGNAAVSPATVVALWMGSEGHRANILNPEYTKLAVGFDFDLDSEYKTYWSEFFSTY